MALNEWRSSVNLYPLITNLILALLTLWQIPAGREQSVYSLFYMPLPTELTLPTVS